MKSRPAQARADLGETMRGNRLGVWFFRISLRAFGLRGAYGLLYFVCAYYALFDRLAVRAAAAYLSRRFPGLARWKRFVAVYRLFINQGKNLLDRFYMISDLGGFDIRFEQVERVREVIHRERKGFILLMSHMGNWQVVMNALPGFNRTVHLLMRPEENPAVKRALDISGAGDNVRIISPEADLGGILDVLKAIEAGEIVSIMGDRSYEGGTVEVTFLGDRVRFPHAAFSIAAGLGCPVIALLPEKLTARRYDLTVGGIYHPAYEKGRSKREQIREWVQEYARVLERYVERNPYQCFLFRDIWSAADPHRS